LLLVCAASTVQLTGCADGESEAAAGGQRFEVGDTDGGTTASTAGDAEASRFELGEVRAFDVPGRARVTVDLTAATNPVAVEDAQLLLPLDTMMRLSDRGGARAGTLPEIRIVYTGEAEFAPFDAANAAEASGSATSAPNGDATNNRPRSAEPDAVAPEDPDFSRWNAVVTDTGSSFSVEISTSLLLDIYDESIASGTNLGFSPEGFDGDALPDDAIGAGLSNDPAKAGDPRSISGADDRTAVWGINGTTSSLPPYRMIGRLTNNCSAQTVGPRHLLTAAHCLRGGGGPATGAGATPWLDFQSFIAGQNGTYQTASVLIRGPGAPASVGAAFRAVMWVPAGWNPGNVPGSTLPLPQQPGNDIGFVVLGSDPSQRIGDTVGWMGYFAATDSYLNARTLGRTGYPICSGAFYGNYNPAAAAGSFGGTCRTTGAACNTGLFCNTNPPPNTPNFCHDDRTDFPPSCVPNHQYRDPTDCEVANSSVPDTNGWNRVSQHRCDASAGDSGSALWFYQPDVLFKPLATGVHYGSPCGKGPNDVTCASVGRLPYASDFTRLTSAYGGQLGLFLIFYP
jgi:V8-like Glu-specific endopeptidase